MVLLRSVKEHLPLTFSISSVIAIIINALCAPVLPHEPISSLSTRIATAVVFGVSTSSIPLNVVYAQTLSSCPYAPTKLSSSPTFFAFCAGTISISALIKLSSVIP